MTARHLLQRHTPADSPVRRVSATVKLIAAVLLVAGLTLLPARHAAWALVPFAALVGLARVARLPLSVFALHLALAQPFVLGVAVLSLFQHDGLLAFASVALKSTVCVAAIQLLVLTTHFQALLEALRRARVPSALVLALGVVHRYLFVLVEELRRMRRARAARTFRAHTGGSWVALASVIGVSFVRSMARSERIAMAMRARGWS
jgi:cobalt/nickel transport system permease protein